MRTLRLLTASLLFVVSVGLCSCSKDFVDEPPKSSITVDTYFDSTDSLFQI